MNVKQEPEWRKSFMLRAFVHNSKLKNAMVFQYWVTFKDEEVFWRSFSIIYCRYNISSSRWYWWGCLYTHKWFSWITKPATYHWRDISNIWRAPNMSFCDSKMTVAAATNIHQCLKCTAKCKPSNAKKYTITKLEIRDTMVKCLKLQCLTMC